MGNGNIVFLNGTSSSGKTTLARALQESLDDPYICVSLDTVWTGLPEWFARRPDRGSQFPVLDVVRAFHQAIVAYSRAGVGVIVDHVITWDTGMRECIELFRDSRVIFVEVVCALQELRERERARGNRKIGQAEAQIPAYEAFRTRFPYDLQVDTSQHSPIECARMVIAVLNDSTVESSFEKMRGCKAGEPSVGGDGKPAPQP